MVRVDWDRILSINAETLTDDEIEDLFPMVIRCDVDDIKDSNNLRALMKISQEMLQHKDNQVESLLLECDELKEKVSTAQNDPAKSQRKMSQVIETDDIEKDNSDSKQTDLPMNDNYPGTTRMKNDKIENLMRELEELEEENETLKRKLEVLKEEMEDATDSMNEMTEELEQLREKNISFKDKIEQLRLEKTELTSQINDLNSQQTERDKMIDDFSVTINAKIEEWKSIIDERDAEIARLKEELAQALAQSVSSMKARNEAEIVQLNDKIIEREKIIIDLQEKLLEAAVEINEGAALIEKLKKDAKKHNKAGRRKEQRDLLKKIQDANEKISALQELLRQAENEATLRSERLCEVLGNLKKFEDRDPGLAETLMEVRELKEKLRSKHDHVRDLIKVINNLEMLNSCREMQILALREKLGIPEDEEISIEGIALKSQEDARIRNELIQKNEALVHENFEMKSEIRTLRYKLSKLGDKVDGDAFDTSEEALRSKSVVKYHGLGDENLVSLRQRAELDEIRENVRIVIEENEALRKGMHEILDSIHDQDGKSSVEVHSGTLERLLEALDVRHIAGWYHPAMRIQERLNVVQGSNSELRSQLKQMRKELNKKDLLLRKYAQKEEFSHEITNSDDSDNEEANAPKKSIPPDLHNELDNLQRERESLNRENLELRETLEKLAEQLEALDADLRILESGDDEIKSAFATKSRECAQSLVNVIMAKRKCNTLEYLLNEESSKSYRISKESIDTENAMRKFIADLERRNKKLDSENDALRSNLSNSVSLIEHNELKDKYDELSIRLRGAYESQFAVRLSENLAESAELENPKKIDEISLCEVPECKTNRRLLVESNDELRRQLVDLQKEISNEKPTQSSSKDEKNEVSEKYEQRINELILENEGLSRTLEIVREEAQMHHTTNSLRIFELDNLRHQILDLHAVSEDKDTIARLGFELNSCRATEIELTKRKVQLENEILHLRRDLECSSQKLDEARAQLQDCRKICSTRCRSYEDVIEFLRRQYSGSTSLSALQRFDKMLKNLANDRADIDAKVARANELEESVKLQRELLTDRLKIVERLKDILEEQIGTSNVDSIVQSFSENSQYTLNDIRLKRRITQLENEQKCLNDKLIDCQSTISSMEHEMMNVQRIWYKKISTTSPDSETGIPLKVEQKTASIQARVELQSRQIQTESSGECIAQKVVPKLPELPPSREIETDGNSKEISIALLTEQLKQALELASDRSSIMIKYESRNAEYQAKISALEKIIADKDCQLTRSSEFPAEHKNREDSKQDCDSEKAALNSTIKSLRKMIDQKEETISRYQDLLKDDRDEHSNAAARFQLEIKALREEISRLESEAQKQREISIITPPTMMKSSQEPIKDSRTDIEAEETIARLRERASTLEAELHISMELGERWHRLAEERLQNMDHMRERLEEQHKNELESYRLELTKWQNEADTLRQQLSENRVQLSKGNISLVKDLQERDNKIHELTVAYQQLQSEFEMMETMTMSQTAISLQENSTTKIQEMAQAFGRDQANHYQSELEILRRQIKSQSDKEKMYKDQISDLKQQLSRRYMAVKSEERRASNRETQLERKLKALEEELNKARIQLDREYRAHEAKRIKTAEELSLWEKQKKWQQIAERLKKEVKDKEEEYKKLNVNYEKLRAVVTCMEREKWYLRSKLRSESASASVVSATPRNELPYKFVENLQIECQSLRDRVKELTDRLESEDSRRTICQLEQQRGRIAALEAVTEGNTFVIDQLEKLETAKANLEKTNIRLESENFELRMEMEKRNHDTPRLREKVEHLEKYVELLKVEKSSETTPRSSDKDLAEPKKSVMELEKTIFLLKRIVEKLQVENKRLKDERSKMIGNRTMKTYDTKCQKKNDNISSRTIETDSPTLVRNYELARKRVIALETDLQLAEQRIAMLENTRKEEDDAGQIGVLTKQLAHKSELLDRVKQLLTRAAINEKALRQRIQQIELKQTLSTIPECSNYSSPTN